jgi:hypothetical protein
MIARKIVAHANSSHIVTFVFVSHLSQRAEILDLVAIFFAAKEEESIEDFDSPHVRVFVAYRLKRKARHQSPATDFWMRGFK